MWDLWLAVTSRRRVVGCSSQWLWVSRLTLRAVITVWRVLLDCACAGWYLAGRIRNYYCLCRVYRYDLYASLVFDSQPVAADCEQKWVRERGKRNSCEEWVVVCICDWLNGYIYWIETRRGFAVSYRPLLQAEPSVFRWWWPVSLWIDEK